MYTETFSLHLGSIDKGGVMKIMQIKKVDFSGICFYEQVWMIWIEEDLLMQAEKSLEIKGHDGKRKRKTKVDEHVLVT